MLLAACGGGGGGAGSGLSGAAQGGASNGGDGTGASSTGANTGIVPETTTPSACTVSGAPAKVAVGPSDSFALHWEQDHYLLVYGDASGGAISTVTLDANGNVTGAPNPIATTAAHSTIPTIAKTKSGYVVAWQELATSPVVHAALLDPTGRLASDVKTLATVSSKEARPVVAEAEDGTAIAWMDADNGAGIAEVGMLDDTLTLKAGPTRLGMGAASHPWVAGNGKNVAVVWSDQRAGQFDTHFGELDGAMTLTDDVALRSGAQKDALLGRMIKTTGGWLAAWEDPRSGTNQIYMAITDESGNPSFTGVVEQGAGDANWPNMASRGDATAVVYYQFRDGGNSQIYLTLVDGTGTRIAGGGDLKVSDTPKMAKARFPDVAWTGTQFGVAWVDTREGESSPGIWFANVACQ